MRINRFLASVGLGSRRKCEKLIREGRVEINGERVSEFARFIDTDSDLVTVDGKAVETERELVVLVINKPPGILSAVSDDRGRKTVVDLAREMGYGGKLYPVGRLDMNTTGLLILTNDGELAYRLTHPRYKIEKRYIVTIEGWISDDSIESIRSGVDLGGILNIKKKMQVLERKEDKSILEIRLREGKKRQIRRMFAESGYRVVELRRNALGDLEFGDLETGGIRPLTSEEEKRLRKLTGLL
jgi:pseudouridine synthase